MTTARIGIPVALAEQVSSVDCASIMRIAREDSHLPRVVKMEALARWVQTDNRDGHCCFS